MSMHMGEGMGSQTPTPHEGIGPMRTYWSPEMERYFVELMVEHMQRGHRIGHTFNKQAWTDMLNNFNAKFESHYDKDSLKSRYTNLWKQFNDVKNLLNHNGFSWDESRQMVIADECAWDTYLKVHPDAQSYKTKAVMNFHELCLIYEYTTADGRYSISSHDRDINDEVEGTAIGDILGHINNGQSRTEWTAEMDEYLIELLLDEVGRGNKTDDTISKEAWTDIHNSFTAKFGKKHSRKALRHRHRRLWKYYSDMTTLLKQDGFSWDESCQMITADDDIWDAYIKAHPFARTYRMKSLPNYADLVLIYGSATDYGKSSHLPRDKDSENSSLRSEEKGSQTPMGSERMRTYWTLPMDHYLLDLLLDQVQRGNRFGQSFLSHAWNDMITFFNYRFNSKYDRGVLKNRYKQLRKLYNEIKTLLQQSGFIWDETRDMIVAEDHVWNAYIEAHPDARMYRIKTMPSYHKLSVLFGEEISNRRYSRLAQNVGPESNALFSKPGVHDWTPEMEGYFIDLMLDQINKGIQIFSDELWFDMVDMFNGRFELKYDKHLLQNQYIYLMKQHGDISHILKHDGFVWDAINQMLVAEDHFWQACLKDFPDAILYKDKCLSNYVNLCKIFGNVAVPIGGTEGQDLGVESDYCGLAIALQRLSEELDRLPEGNKNPDEDRKRSPSVPPDAGPSKVQRTGEEMRNAFPETEIGGTTSSNKQENKNNTAKEDAIHALNDILDIDERLLLDAIALFQDERKAKTFLVLDPSLRRRWLLRKLQPQL